MPRLSFYVSDDVEMQIRIKAKQANLSLSKYLAEIVQREAADTNKWPVGYFDLFDAWQGEPQSAPTNLQFETRLGI